jgi:Clr5 domain
MSANDGKTGPRWQAGRGDWDRHRALITRLYDGEDKPLREVRRIMLEEYGFEAS